MTKPWDGRTSALAALRQAAADRPVHAALLEALIAWQEAGGAGDGPKLEVPGMSWALAIDLAGDVEAAYAEPRASEYIRKRDMLRRAAGKRAATLASSGGLGDLLPPLTES